MVGQAWPLAPGLRICSVLLLPVGHPERLCTQSEVHAFGGRGQLSTPTPGAGLGRDTEARILGWLLLGKIVPSLGWWSSWGYCLEQAGRVARLGPWSRPGQLEGTRGDYWPPLVHLVGMHRWL